MSDAGVAVAQILVSLAGITAGTWIVVWQVRGNARQELKLRIYEQLAALIQKATHEISSISAMTQSLHSSIVIDRDSPVRDHPDRTPLAPSNHDLLDQWASASAAMLEIVFWLERYEVAGKGFKVFRFLLWEASRKQTEAFNQLNRAVDLFLPIRVENEGRVGRRYTLGAHLPSPETVEQVRVLGEQHTQAAWEVLTYLADISRDAQNQLLGSLFRARVPKRKPLLESSIVLSSDREDLRKLSAIADESLRRWNETALGRRPRESGPRDETK